MSEVIELNNHRLLNGDATNKEDVNKLIGDCKVNLLLTDPPYGIDIVKVGGGKSEDKAEQSLDLSERERERERESKWEQSADTKSNHQNRSTIGGAKPPTFKKGGQIAYGKVGKPMRCSAKII